MFKPEIGSTFSDTWYRVGPTRPRLSVHAHVVRQRHAIGPAGAGTGGGGAGGTETLSYIIEEPASGGYFRLTEPAYAFLGLLDGRRTVAEAWDTCNARLGDDAPTQRECTDALGKLQLFGLLTGDLPLAPDMVLERKRQSRERRRERRTGRWLFFSVPLLNPERFLERHRRPIEALFSPVGLLLWLAVAAVAVALVIINWRRVGDELNTIAFLDPANLLYAGLAFTALRTVHEFGHAAACKAFGGRVVEMGLIFIAGLLPLPYCDTTAAWRFPQVRHRVAVSLGGVLAEGVVAALATTVWAFSGPGLLHSLCYNTMLVSGLSTFVFNLNPLLRYDGYYILADVAGSPNLAQRANELWRVGLQRTLFGVRSLPWPPVRDGAEAALLILYGLLSTPYRIVVTATLVLLVAVRYPSLGLILAAVLAMVWFVWPVLKWASYLLTAPALAGRRARAIGVVAALAGGLAVFLSIVPMPARAYAPATLEARVRAPVRAGEAGFVREVLAAPGEPVRAGQPLFILENPETLAARQTAEARLARAGAELQKTAAGAPAEREVALRNVAALTAELARAVEQEHALTVHSPASGRLVSPTADRPDARNEAGRFIKRGALLALVISSDDLVVRASVSDADAASIFRNAQAPLGAAEDPPAPLLAGQRVTFKIKGMAGVTLPARVLRVVPAGSRDLQDPSLSTAAGDTVAPDPEDHSGRRTLDPHFTIEMDPAPASTPDSAALPAGVQPGARARVRFELPPEPLLRQWTRTVRQYIEGRFG